MNIDIEEVNHEDLIKGDIFIVLVDWVPIDVEQFKKDFDTEGCLANANIRGGGEMETTHENYKVYRITIEK